MAQNNGTSLKSAGQHDTLTARALRTMAAELRAVELECELATAREGLVHRDNAILSLEKSLDLNAAENLRLAEQLAESSVAAEKARAQLERTRSLLSAAQAERKEANEKRQAETAQLSAQLEAALARATNAENQLADAQQNFLVMNFHNSASEKRNESLENSLYAKERELQDLRLAHAGLTDDAEKLCDDKMKLSGDLTKLSDELSKLSSDKRKLSDDLAKLSSKFLKLTDEINARDTALAHAEDRINLLSKLFKQLEAKAHEDGRQNFAGSAGGRNFAAPGSIGIDAVAEGQRGECAVLKRDLDSDAWLFGGGKAVRLS